MKKPNPWAPRPFTEREAYAIQALETGTANEGQQQLALKWILQASRLRDETFVEGKDDVRLFLQGKRSVGLNIVEALNWKKQGE